jgi:hypothetical protein
MPNAMLPPSEMSMTINQLQCSPKSQNPPTENAMGIISLSIYACMQHNTIQYTH